MYERWLKRPLDLALILASAPLTVPLLLLVAGLVRLSLGRPVIFRQERPGLGGRAVRLLKFRTMTEVRDGAGELLPDGERLSAFGRFLRSTSLDELPELINVLRGDMSIVGPRPLLTEYLERYTPEQRRRHDVRPGITGWAQVNGRNALDWETKFELDVWYVDHGGFLLDARILAQTVLSVFQRRGITRAGHDTAPKFMGSPEP